jgi:hypothetical protein
MPVAVRPCLDNQNLYEQDGAVVGIQSQDIFNEIHAISG